MVTFGIGLYLLLTLGIGYWASCKVKDEQDYLLAGRSLPVYLSTAALFATWFGAESVLGASSEVARHGLIAAIEDPFGAALCLLLIGLWIARPLYNMNLLTFGDFYRRKFGRNTEIVASLMLVISYLSWVAAQFVALGLLTEVMLGLPMWVGTVLGATIVTAYTFQGGMWSISILDFVQNIVIILGLAVCCYIVVDRFDILALPDHLPKGYFRITPQSGSTNWLNWLAAWLTIGLGSLPQQDVFQRIMAAKNARTAVLSGFLGSVLYVTVALMPLFIATVMRAYRPDLLSGDEQFILPTFVRDYTPQWVQLLFFGALLSAILSTASGALLAPAAIMGENLLRNLFPNTIKNNLLRYTRLSVISLAAVSLLLGISRNNIFELVSESSALSLVSLFVPMVAGLYFRRSPALAALVSMPVGFVVWLLALTFQTDINPILYGLVASGVSYALTAGVYRYWRRKTLRAHKRARAARRRKRHSIM